MITEQQIKNETIRALSWRQPYAALMEHGKLETRRWATNYRGLVLICASVKSYNQAEIHNISGDGDPFKQLETTLKEDTGERWKLTGVASSIGRLIGCVQWKSVWSDLAELNALELQTFCKYNPEVWIHQYEDVTPIEPFPWKGQQGWRTLTDTDKAKIKLLPNETAKNEKQKVSKNKTPVEGRRTF